MSQRSRSELRHIYARAACESANPSSLCQGCFFVFFKCPKMKTQRSRWNSEAKLFCFLPRRYKSLRNKIIKQTDLATQLGLQMVSLVCFGPITNPRNTKCCLDSGNLYKHLKTAKHNMEVASYARQTNVGCTTKQHLKACLAYCNNIHSFPPSPQFLGGENPMKLCYPITNS